MKLVSTAGPGGRKAKQMFTCQKCKTITKPYEKEFTIVTERRAKTYEVPPRSERGQSKRTNGWEIVKSIKVCPTCAEKYMASQLEVNNAPTPTGHRQDVGMVFRGLPISPKTS